MSYSLKHQIKDLRSQSLQSVLLSLTLFTGASFFSDFVPAFLYKYYYASKQLLEEPLLFKLVPVIAFSIATLYFIYMLLANMLRERQISLLKKQVSMNTGCSGHCQDGHCVPHEGSAAYGDDKELSELEKLVDEAIAEAEAAAQKTSSKKKTTKKTTKSKTKSKKK